ncbi:MAG: lasso peptide biosynthesis B2 protein [bacterium]|nr:lasso peptide biosynthesis B2 protein [bacterium]
MSTRRSKRETWRKAAFFVAALPAVLRAAARLAWLDRRCDLRELADRLRQVRPWRESYLTNPRYLDGSVNRLAGLLPPRRHGRCMKRSFLLLDLWSRCGLNPTIHIGTLKDGDDRRFHAWVTVPDGDGAYSHSASEYAELWSH